MAYTRDSKILLPPEEPVRIFKNVFMHPYLNHVDPNFNLTYLIFFLL